MTTDSDDKPKDGDAQRIARYWQLQLAMAERSQKSFIDDGRKIIERYKSEKTETSRRTATARKFNILFSNTEVLRAALFGKMAKPDVRRRFADRNPVARNVAEVLERSLIYQQDTYPADRHIDHAIMDYLLPGRGVVRIDYEPELVSEPVFDPMGMPVFDEEGQPVQEQFIADQKLCEKYVFWEDFRCEPARNWHQVNWVAYRHTFSQDELADEIFDKAPESSQVFGAVEDVPLNWSPDTGAKDKEIPEELKKAEVWEVWDKKERKRLWIVDGYKFPLRIDEDPYSLDEFFPNPEPLKSYTSTDDEIPEAEFKAYQDQADDLDEITARISRLTRALKRRGVYDKSLAELRRLASAGDNEFIPVANYAELMQKGGLAKAFETEDITVIATVLNELYKQRDMLVQAIYELTGISDIVRGATNPNETLGAQQLKAQFGSNRLRRRQNDVARFIRDLYQLKAQIIAEHFEPDVLSQMTGIQVTPEMMQILRDEKARGYQIDVETDSTSFEDAEQEKKSRIEFLTAVSQFLSATVPLATQMPMIAPLLVQMLNFGVRGFKTGRELEDVIEQTGQQIQQMMTQPKPPPPPDPKIKQIEAEMQRDGQKHEMDMQGKVIDLQLKREKAQMDMQGLLAKQAMPQVPNEQSLP
jgi:hypothetical protein